MSIGEKIRKIVEEVDEKILFLQKEFNDALIGTARACGKNDVAAYDLTKCLEIMIKNHGIDEIEALEQIENSIDKAPSGTYKPIFINDFRKIKDVPKNLKEIKEDETLQDITEKDTD